jgi:two-component system cell cycle response regulator CpdR
MAEILIADDEAATRDLMRRALEGDGHRVSVVADGSEALERLASGGIDLLITDVQMPGLDGIKLAAKALAMHPGLRILLMSGYAEQLERGAALGGKVGTLGKPFTLEKARAEVRAALA